MLRAWLVSSMTLCFSLAGCGSSDEAPERVLPGPALSGFEERTVASVAELGLRPFDVDRNDVVGPRSHNAQYGKTPELVVVPGEGYLDVLARSTDEAVEPQAFLLRLTETAEGVALTRAFAAPTLGLVLGFARGEQGEYYYATGALDDDLTQAYPSPGQRRANVVRVYRVSAEGAPGFDVDLDLARREADAECEAVINPATASSARLAVAGGLLALVAGNNTEPDAGGTRHQKAVTTLLDAATGAVVGTSSIWVSHSFDQRYLRDGDDLYELHLGDAYPRAVVTTRLRGGAAGGAFSLVHPKGETGDNNTYTRLGDLVRTASGGFLALVATESTEGTAEKVNGSRELALVRLVPGFADSAPEGAVDPGFGEPVQVTSAGEVVSQRLHRLTTFQADSGGTRHAERPKLIALGGDEFIVLYEQWTTAADDQTFDGTFALLVDADGVVAAGPARVSDHHLPRGDDAFAYGGGAAWLTGDEEARTLTLHRVDRALGLVETVVR